MGHEGNFKRTDVTFVFLKVFFVKVVAFMRLATFTIHVVTRKQQFGVCDCNIYCSLNGFFFYNKNCFVLFCMELSFMRHSGNINFKV